MKIRLLNLSIFYHLNYHYSFMGLVFVLKGSIYSTHSELYGTKEPASALRPSQMGVPATSLHPQTVIILLSSMSP